MVGVGPVRGLGHVGAKASAAPRRFDVIHDRKVPTAVEHLWRGWTDPTTLVRWCTPAPWRTTEAEVGFEPGRGAALDQLVARFA